MKRKYDEAHKNPKIWQLSLALSLGLALTKFIPKALKDVYAHRTGLETKVMQPIRENVGVERLKINDAKEYRISKNGTELIKQFEGFSPALYDDMGKNAIGYGHRIKKDENFYEINEEKAEKLLRGDLVSIERAISEYVGVPLTQNQYDALCSFVYNVGRYNFEKSTLLKKLNKRDYKGAAEEFEKWVHVYDENGEKTVIPGLVTRRQIERELFLFF